MFETNKLVDFPKILSNGDMTQRLLGLAIQAQFEAAYPARNASQSGRELAHSWDLTVPTELQKLRQRLLCRFKTVYRQPWNPCLSFDPTGESGMTQRSGIP